MEMEMEMEMEPLSHRGMGILALRDNTVQYIRAAVLGALWSIVIGGCGPQRSRPVTEFPNRKALASVTAGPAPSLKFDAGQVPEQGWTVEATVAPSGGTTAPSQVPWQARTAWDQAAIKAIKEAGRSPRFTEAMSCAARELGRWMVSQQKATPPGLRRFMAGACGVVSPQLMIESFGGDVPPEVSDDVILTRWGDQIRSQLVSNLPAAATDAGFAFVRAGGRVSAVLVYAQAQAQLDPFSIYPSEAGELSFVGTVSEPAELISGYINQGRYGVVPCDVDPAVPRPRFRVTCKMLSEDETAWVDLVYAKPRRVLANTFVRVLARRSSVQQLQYMPPHHASGQAAGGEQFAQAAVTALNEARAQAGLTPVRLNAAQTATAMRVAPYYFGAMLDPAQDERQEIIALGLLAGWDVQGMIRDGGFISTLVPQTHDPARWLAETLEMPMGRSSLLSKDVEEIALGSVLPDQPLAAGALVVGYRFHRSADHQADIVRLVERARAARSKRLLPAPIGFPDLDKVMRAELQKVHFGKAEPIEALGRILEIAGSQYGVSLKGYVVETTSIDAVQIPEEVLAQPILRVEIGVTHHKPKGAAWAQLVILVVFQDYGVKEA